MERETSCTYEKSNYSYICNPVVVTLHANIASLPVSSLLPISSWTCCLIYQTSRYGSSHGKLSAFGGKSFPFRKTFVVTKFFVLSWHFHSFTHLRNAYEVCSVCQALVYWSMYWGVEMSCGTVPSRNVSNSGSQGQKPQGKQHQSHASSCPDLYWPLGEGKPPRSCPWEGICMGLEFQQLH